MTGVKYILFFLVMATQITAQGQKIFLEKVAIPGSKLTNCYRIDEHVYRADQPSSSDFKALEKFGIREVLNLRYWHSDDDEAQGTNIKLHRIETRAMTIDEAEITKALKIIQNRKGPIVFHCLHGSDRTGAVCAMYRIVFQNISKEEAIREMTEGGFGFHFIFNQIVDVIRRADVNKMKKELNLNH